MPSTGDNRKHHNNGYISEITGRRRKLSDGAMIDIRTQYAKGAKTSELAKQYGVSTHTIGSVVYWTRRVNG